MSNLKNFRGEQKLKQAALAFIASQLVTKDETEHLEKIFQAIDKDGDGNLSKEEILEGYEDHFGVPISEEEVDKMFLEIDIDGNGSIDYTEFVMATMNTQSMVNNEKLELAFKMFDKVSISITLLGRQWYDYS